MDIKVMVKRITLSLAFIIIIVVGALLAIFIRPTVSTSFATGVTLVYKYLDQDVDVTVTDLETIKELSEIMKGRAYIDSPSCGFSIDVF